MDGASISSSIGDHLSLSTTCIDRIYLNAYLPRLQTSGQLVYFLRDHLGNPLPSPALFRPLHDRFVASVQRYAEAQGIPVVHFQRGERKDDVANEWRRRFTAEEGVVFIGVAQEKASSFKAQKLVSPQGFVEFAFSRQPVAVNHFYCYFQDREWGPGFLKIGTYLPYPVKLCLNGHEWVKQQLRHEGIGFDALDNGFLACAQPDRLQELADQLGPDAIQACFDRWSARLPWPLSPEDREAGYRHRLSIWQLEVSLTQVFERPIQGRHFFEGLIRENLDLGRPDRVSLLFPSRTTRRTPPPAHGYRTRVITAGVNPALHVDYRHSHVKQYFKEERALRTETTINDPGDFGARKAIQSLPYLREVGQAVNRRLLEVERLSQSDALTDGGLQRLLTPTHDDGRRVPALRFGDARAMALLHALCRFGHLPAGFRNRDLREHVQGLLGRTYSPGAMTYDLRRLRLRGLIHRLPRTHRYTVTTHGLRVALFFTRVYLRVLRPGWAALTGAPIAPRSLRNAFLTLETEIDRLCHQSGLASSPTTRPPTHKLDSPLKIQAVSGV